MRGNTDTSRIADVSRTAVKCGAWAFIQILSKFYFFQLLENLRLILFDYGQNRAVGANVAFNATC